jgi:hypothetical protein
VFCSASPGIPALEGWAAASGQLGGAVLVVAELTVHDQHGGGLTLAEAHPAEQVGEFVLRGHLGIDQRVEEHGGSQIGGPLGHGVELLQRGGDFRLQLEGGGHDLLGRDPVLPRCGHVLQQHGLAAGDQVVGEGGGVLLLAVGFVLEEVGEAPQFALGEPDGHGEVGGTGLALDGEVVLQGLHQGRFHRLGQGTTGGTGGHGAAAGGGADLGGRRHAGMNL